MDRLAQMLKMQRDLQVVLIGRDPGELPIDAKIDFMKNMIIAGADELHEALAEFDWKPWTQGDRAINADGVKKELVDLWHFFMNMMLAVGMDTDELYKMYMKKRLVNINRHENGYDGKSTKCLGCKRALEDVALKEVKLVDSDITDVVFCQCGTVIPTEIALPFLTD